MKQLPSISHPTLTTVLPLSQKKIHYRPFINKEKKVMLLAKETDDWDSAYETIRSVVLSCTSGGVDISNIPVCDAAYLFVKLRIQSIGNIIPLQTICKNDECGKEINMNYDLDTINVDLSKWNPVLQMTPEIGINFKAPTFEDMKHLDGDNVDAEKFIISIIGSIFDNDEVYDVSEYTHEQIVDFLDQFDEVQLKKIQELITNIPQLTQKIEYNCPHCKHPHSIKLEGLSDFF